MARQSPHHVVVCRDVHLLLSHQLEGSPVGVQLPCCNSRQAFSQPRDNPLPTSFPCSLERHICRSILGIGRHGWKVLYTYAGIFKHFCLLPFSRFSFSGGEYFSVGISRFNNKNRQYVAGVYLITLSLPEIRSADKILMRQWLRQCGASHYFFAILVVQLAGLS